MKTAWDRFTAKFLFVEGGCWEWTASCTESGYGQFFVGQRRCRDHRFAYETLVGPVPAGLELDHLCRNRLCVNPAHLEPVTRRVNQIRGESPFGINARKTHCDSGHPFDAANTHIDYRGRRKCRACDREFTRLRKIRDRANRRAER